MSKLKSALTKDQQYSLPYLGRLAEDWWREFCKPSYRNLAEKGPEAVYKFFDKLGTKAQDEQCEMMQQGVAEDGALEIVKEYLYPRGEENMK